MFSSKGSSVFFSHLLGGPNLSSLSQFVCLGNHWHRWPFPANAFLMQSKLVLYQIYPFLWLPLPLAASHAFASWIQGAALFSLFSFSLYQGSQITSQHSGIACWAVKPFLHVWMQRIHLRDCQSREREKPKWAQDWSWVHPSLLFCPWFLLWALSAPALEVWFLEELCSLWLWLELRVGSWYFWNTETNKWQPLSELLVATTVSVGGCACVAVRLQDFSIIVNYHAVLREPVTEHANDFLPRTN